jgi:hypothetical protein
MNNFAFQKHLQMNVVEAYVSRRHAKPKWSNTRGIFATTNRNLLNSIEGLRAMGFKAPVGIGMGYEPLEKNCVVAFDILVGCYRVFSMDGGVNILNSFKVNTPQNILKFWSYFTDYVLRLSPDDKYKFLGKISA